MVDHATNRQYPEERFTWDAGNRRGLAVVVDGGRQVLRLMRLTARLWELSVGGVRVVVAVPNLLAERYHITPHRYDTS